MTSIVESYARDYIANGWRVVPIEPGEKACRLKGWPDLVITAEEVPRYFGHDKNIGVITGSRSQDLADIDFDCPEAIELAALYLPKTECIFGRASKPKSHWLYIAPGARHATFGDPCAKGAMLVELRADGQDRGAHCTTMPPSIHPSGEAVKWDLRGGPRPIAANLLARSTAWLAIACLVARYLSPASARQPADDFSALLWEFDPELGRCAFKWLGRPAPDEVQQSRQRRRWTPQESNISEVVAQIPNDFDWNDWNRIGMAIWNASGGSDVGLALFDRFSAQHPRYQPAAVTERWKNYSRGRPSKIGMGTLVHFARAGWRRGGQR